MSHVLIQDPSSISIRFSNENRLGCDESCGSDDYLRNDSEAELEGQENGDGVDEGDNKNDAVEALDFELIERYLTRIPAREADLITLYYRDKLKQEQIANLFNITQAAVSYRLHRGIIRIKFLRTIPELEHDKFELELGPKFSEQDKRILWLMYETTCQSEIAKIMGLTQGRVRHRFFRSLKKIESLVKEEIHEKEINLQIKARKHTEARLSKKLSNPETLRTEVDKEVEKYMNSEEIRDEVKEAGEQSKYQKYYKVYSSIADKHFNILHEVSLPQFKDRGDARILTL